VISALHRWDCGRSVCALLLAPALYVSLWLEVIGGTGETWNNVQTGQFDLGGAIFHMCFALAGPIAVVIATLTSRTHKEDVHGRVLRIEGWGLAISCPFAVAGLLAIALAGII
jgi:hypothetical protein